MTMTATIKTTRTRPLDGRPGLPDGMTAVGRPPDSPPPGTTVSAARISGRQLAAGLGAAAALAAVGAGVTIPLARAIAPQWAHTEGLTVLIVAEVYLALAAGLVIGVGGLAGAGRLLALRRPAPRQVGAALAVAVGACAAGLAVSMAFSPLSGGPVATLEAIVRAGSDESLMVAATPVPPVIAITAVLFACEHAYYPVLLPLVLSFGLAAGWVRQRTGTVGATIPMHIAVDLSLFLAAVALA